MIASRLLRVVSITISVALLSGMTLQAQTIAGVVAGEISGEGLAGAIVLLFDHEDTERGAILTQPDGRFEIQVPGPGTYRLRVERIGYASTISAPLVVDNGPDSPYVSRSARQFAQLGYADVHDDHVQYYGPDAAALVSNSFLDRHCFRLIEKRGPRGLLGIAFSPLQGYDKVDIEGVVWVDRASGGLDHLEFGYVGLPWRHHAAVATGRIGFRRLVEGGWIVESWWLRAPLFRDSLGHGPVVGIKEVGGEVTGIKGPELRTGPDDRS